MTSSPPISSSWSCSLIFNSQNMRGADLPDFIVGDAIASGGVEVILKDWKQTEGAVHLVMPPAGPRPAGVKVLAEFLAKHFAKGKKRK
jgi:DNA-binding transcriptional LysR family regulator